MGEFWMLLAELEDLSKKEAGEAKKQEMLNDKRYEAK
jgi:hypothetical protein